MKKVLIAYVTKTGTTREIALVIEKTLKAAGVEARTLPMSEAGDLSGYDRVILGAPINGMRLVPEAAAFVEAHGAELRARPVALFAVSYMHGAARGNWNRAIEKSVRSAAETAGARTSAIFSGRVGSSLPGVARLIFGVPRNLPADRVDPEAVRAWAADLPKALA